MVGLPTVIAMKIGSTIIPAKAGIQGPVVAQPLQSHPPPPLDSGLRRNDVGFPHRTLQGAVGEPNAGCFHNNSPWPCGPHTKMKMVRHPHRHSRESGNPGVGGWDSSLGDAYFHRNDGMRGRNDGGAEVPLPYAPGVCEIGCQGGSPGSLSYSAVWRIPASAPPPVFRRKGEGVNQRAMPTWRKLSS